MNLTPAEAAEPTFAELYAAAVEAVRPHYTKFKQYEVVPREAALSLMGEERMAKFVKDKIIGLGPRGYDGFYSWNVAAGMVKVWEE